VSVAANQASEGGPAAQQRPLLAPWCRTVEDGSRLLFEHAGHVVELNGRAVQALLPALLPLLDGDHTVLEIVAALGDAAETPVNKALALLDEHGLLVDGPAPVGHAGAACYVAANSSPSPAEAWTALTSSDVTVIGSAPTGAEITHLLASAGVATTTSMLAGGTVGHADLIVAAPAPDEVGQLGEVNRHRLRDATPWLPILPADGRFVAIGPLYVPGQTACHSCYLMRRAATSGYEDDFPLLERQPVRAPSPPGASAIAAGVAALICLRWLGARDPTLPGVLYALELHGRLGLTRHRVLRVPRCPACGATPPEPSPWFRELDAGAARQPRDTGR
jgi:ribosomal protein S12 methylthiotransferase accessory factor